MPLPDPVWGTIQASANSNIAAPLRWTTATSRPHGTLRYRCPVNQGFVVVTDDETLARLARPRARTRCPSCGETHLIARHHGGTSPAAIVGSGDQP